MSPLVRLLTTVVVVLSVVVILEAVVDERQSGDVPGGKVTEGRVWIFQSRRGGGEPCTPTSLTVSLTNAEQLIVRFFFANGGFTNLVYDNPGESFSLPASDLPQDVVLIVIFAPPLSSSTSSCINSVHLTGCGQATTTPSPPTTVTTSDVTTTTEEPTTTTTTTTTTTPTTTTTVTTSDVPTTTEEPTTTTTTTTTSTTTTTTSTETSTVTSTEPMPDCGVSTALDALNQANSGVAGAISAGSCDVIPWQVSVTLPDGLLCGGSIIDASHVLTAAFCIPDSGTLEVIAGNYDITVDENTEQIRTVPVEDATIHPNYTVDLFDAGSNNLAVVRLSEPLDLTQPCVTPVCLDPNLVISGQTCTVSGWQELGVIPVPTLRISNVLTVTGEDCVSVFNVPFAGYIPDPPNQLCAGDMTPFVDFCQGLQGGPLVCRDDSTDTYIQAGIASSANGCGNPRFPIVYTEVSAYYDWILQQINN